MRGQDAAIGAGFQPGEAPLHEVDAAGHGSEVDAFGGGSALDVVDIGCEDLLEELHRAIAVGPGQHPGVHNTAECRSKELKDRTSTITF